MTEEQLRTQAGITASEEWPAYAWPGGYPLIYITDDGEVLCPKCLNDSTNPIHFCESEDGIGCEPDGWRIDAVDVFWEGPPETCAHCGASIESAYGDPEEEQGQ